MKKLSIKLGILFFLIIFGLMTFMFFVLHKAIVESTVDEQLNSLQARGNSHREILSKDFNEETIGHVVLMESESTTDVVITDSAGNILDSSSSTDLLDKYLKKPLTSVPPTGQIVEHRWEKEPFISTISPVQTQGQTIGYVYMFQNTASIQSLIQRLNNHFIMAGWISVVFTLIIIIFLSRGITRPLIKMKEATAEISLGNFSVSLPNTSNDELGDLANSIQSLATDLNHLKHERNEFLASISHELRTPLTYIKGYADLVHKRNPSKEEREKYLSIIVEETNRLSELIKELFDLAKMDENTFAVQEEPINLNDIFNKIKQKLSPAFLEKNIQLQLNYEPNIILNADPIRLEQILYNLLDNALKYSYEGSKVSLKAWKSKNSIHISVQDHGKGIPQKDLPHIFNRFYRVDKSRTRSLGGTGLGLAIVKELVHAHGAEITVNSKENAGTTFELTFQGGQN